jgi:hypothetical protein
MLRYALRKRDPLYGCWFFKFYSEVFAEPIQTLSKKFLPETDATIEEPCPFECKWKPSLSPILQYLNIPEYT